MTEQEFTVRIPPRNEKKNYHIMKFNANMNVDVGKWTQVSMKWGTLDRFMAKKIRGGPHETISTKFTKFKF